MGTSQSSAGSPGGVLMVPPWVPDADADGDGAPAPPAPDAPAPSPAPAPESAPIAPAGRFNGARRALGRYVQTGDPAALRRGVGRYVKVGYGGSAGASRRFGGTARTANRLFSVLGGDPGQGGHTHGQFLDAEPLRGGSAQQLIDAVIEAVRPVDGTQDAEAARGALSESLSELLKQFPDVDLLNPTAEQREIAVERFVALDVYRRFDLDLGKHIREKAPSATVALTRLKQAKGYIRQTIGAAFRKLRDAGRTMTGGAVARLVRAALAEAFRVFEGYAK